MVNILRKLGVNLDFPKEQTCCGQPAFNSGYHREAKDMARRYMKIFKGNNYIIVPSGSCGAMIRVFYNQLFQDEPDVLSELEELSSRVFEFSEFLVQILGITDVDGKLNGDVTYHDCCHLRRELGIISQPRDLIKSVKGINFVELNQSDVCCGFGGTFAIKYPDISGAILDQKIRNIKNSGADILVANDTSCLMHMRGSFSRLGLDIEAMHIAEFLDKAMEG
jgi:L-lactate dehydrogenase complex protein LldE